MELEQRVERLERDNRRLKIAGGAVLLVFVATGLVGAASPQVPLSLQAQEFVLVTESGLRKATFGIGTDGIARLSLGDLDGPRGVEASLNAAGRFFTRERDDVDMGATEYSSSHDLMRQVLGRRPDEI